MDRFIKKGSTDVSVHLYIIDSTNGTPETGVLFNTAGIDLKYRREGAAVVSITEADLVTPLLTDAHLDGGFLEVGNGVYRLDLPDAACAAAAKHVTVFGTVTGMIVLPVEVQLVDFDPDDAVRAGLTALPNAAADAAGGLPISDAGGLDLDALNTAAVRLTAARAGALTDWIDAGRLDLLLDAIPTTAQRGTDNAATAADLLDKLGAVNEAAAAGDPSATESVMQYVKQIVNILMGSAGIVSMPAAAAPANNVSLAEMVRAIYDDTNELQTDDVPGLIAALNDLSAANVIAALEDSGLALVTTTIATLATQVSFTLTAGSADNSAYVGCMAIVEDVTTAAQKAIGLISAYTGATKTVTLVADPGIYTMAATDKISILPVPKQLPAALADGAGGLPVSDAGALDLDTKLANTNEVTAARMAALTDWIDGGRLDLLLDAAKVVTDNMAASAGVLITGLAEAGTLSTTQMTTDLAEATNDHYNGRLITWTSGVLLGQQTDITDYVGANGLLTYTAVTEAPGAGDAFVIQ